MYTHIHDKKLLLTSFNKGNLPLLPLLLLLPLPPQAAA